MIIIFLGAFSRFFRPVCDGGNQPDARADQRSDRRAVLLPFDPLAAFFGVFVIVINDPCYRSGEAVDSTDDAACRITLTFGNLLRFGFCKGAFAQMLIVRLARFFPSGRLFFF